jgi:hypothetical protein
MSPDSSEPKDIEKSETEFIRMYYEHQYDRVAKLEEQGLTITNLVITFSIVAFTFGFNNAQALTIVAGLILPTTMVIANIFAIIYAVSTSEWIQMHRSCAERVLELYAKDVYELDKSVFKTRTGASKRLGRRRIQLLIHALLIAIALVPLLLYLKSITSR